MVLPVLHGPPDAAGRHQADQAMEGDATALRQVELHCEPGDPTCRKRQRQALLHWAYDSRKF
jgi:hypothetical protein